MQKNNAIVKILPQKRQFRADSGRTLMEALNRHGIFLRSDCGGKGTCGKCRVEIISEDHSHKTVKSCECRIDGNMSIQIPAASMLSSHIMSKAPIDLPGAFVDKFKSAKGPDFFGFAVDLGTTTIALYLCNVTTAQVISSIAIKNPQALYGDDVMSRISAVDQKPKNLEKLQTLVVKSIEWGIKTLLSSLGETKVPAWEMVVVGNPTMIHILVGVDPKPIGISPYHPAFYEAATFSAKQLGFDLDEFRIQILPQVSGFIGGDILSAALAVDMRHQPSGTLLVDLGTNGELLIKGEKGIYATSCATGPAFEGASIACGMQAIPGAINGICIDDNGKITRISMIETDGEPETKPSGICGAGVINTITRMYEKKIIEPDGRMVCDEDRYLLVQENRANDQASIYISQKDIRSVQLGKSALISGIEFLLQKAGVSVPEKIIIAGAFGSHLNTSDLICLGIIPDIEPEKIKMVGNAAGAGAVMTLCDKGYIDQAVKMAARINIVDLATDLGFQEIFIKNLSFSGPSTIPGSA